MKKRCKEISAEFEELIKAKSPEIIEKIQNEILEECKKKNEETNKRFFEEKLRNYKLFKSSKSNSKNKEWKNILNLRTHSKKVKKRGRKAKKNKNILEENTLGIEASQSQNSLEFNNSICNEIEDKVIKLQLLYFNFCLN